MIRNNPRCFGLKITARFDGRKRKGNIILRDVQGDLVRDHFWLNKSYNDFPADIPVGSRISFFADIFESPGGPKLTDIREIRVIQ